MTVQASHLAAHAGAFSDASRLVPPPPFGCPHLQVLHLKYIELASPTELAGLTALRELTLTLSETSTSDLDGLAATAHVTMAHQGAAAAAAATAANQGPPRGAAAAASGAAVGPGAGAGGGVAAEGGAGGGRGEAAEAEARDGSPLPPQPMECNLPDTCLWSILGNL